MQTTISSQIKAVQAAREKLSPMQFQFNEDYKKIYAELNDCASTLAALKMILSGDIGKEFEEFRSREHDFNYSAALRGDRLEEGQIFVDFLRSKGLDLTKIK